MIQLLSYLERGINVDTIYLDFSKEFDKVDHAILLHKLSQLGIKGKLLRWIESFLKGRKQSVVLNGFKSVSVPVIPGKPQGTVLGPILFLLMISDIDDNLSGIQSLQALLTILECLKKSKE
eukprot:TCONS_00052991-protein